MKAKFPILWALLASARFLMIGALPVVFLTGCEEGALEEAGEEIDDAVDDVEDEIDRRN
jgi:outer membrane lipoprotein-sorting protein